MNKEIDEVVTELNYMSAALTFIGEALECYEAEDKKLNNEGVSYIVKVLSQRSSKVADLCWNIKSACRNTSIKGDEES